MDNNIITNDRKTLYLFLDESGNYDFSTGGTRYLTFTCVSTNEPHICVIDLYNLKHQLIKTSHVEEVGELEHFHASEDKQLVRNEVFNLLEPCSHFSIDTVIVEKSKVNPVIRDIDNLYLKIYEILMKHVLRRYSATDYSDLIIIIDAIETKKKRKAAVKSLKTSLASHIQPRKRCTILHHQSKSHFYLQIADYCCWAVYVKWEKGETRPHERIKGKIRSEFDVFSKGNKKYY